MNTFDASAISIYSTPENQDTVIFADGSMWVIRQRDGRNWGLHSIENNELHLAIGLHLGMNELCSAINKQDEFLRYLLRTQLSTDIHRGEHYV